ncbi:MAG: hypothetical protein DME34_10740 [Verrucomicrobia bacterium]|nr:MAG: hypothetical protein DME34_10740 [Verrucomicrobiota bacterium]
MSADSLGQLILTGVPGKELDAKTAGLFRRVQPGGFILFGRNINTPAQLRKLIDDLRELSTTEPIITIDQEGGRVSRLRLIGNEPPNAQQFRDKADLDLIRRHGEITGRLLRLFGFNLIRCVAVATARASSRSAVTPAHSTTRCADKASPAAANIFPVIPPPNPMRTTNCRASIARLKNCNAPN